MDDESTAIRAALARLDGDELAAFAADLWRARGRTVDRDGQRLVATADGAERTVRVVAATGRLRPDPSLPRDVDVVVTAALVDDSPPGVEVVDGPELASMLRYAVERGTADTLCERHLGGPPDALTLPFTVRARRTLAGVDARRAAGAIVLVATAVVLAVVTAPVAIGPAGLPGDLQVSGATGDADRPLPSGATDVPGVGTQGVNATALAAAHERALEDTSYRLTVTRIGPATDGRSTRRVTITWVGDERFRQTRRVVADDTLSAHDVFYDGTGVYASRYENGSFRHERLGTIPPEPRASTVADLREYLGPAETRVAGVTEREDRRLYRVVGSRTGPYLSAGSLDYTVEALVDSRGLVHRFDVEFGDRDESSRYTWRFEDLGETDPPAPLWYERRFDRASSE